jgi:hypothetical protein
MARKRSARGLPPLADETGDAPPMAGVREPRRPRPPTLDDAIALPEPDAERPTED